MRYLNKTGFMTLLCICAFSLFVLAPIKVYAVPAVPADYDDAVASLKDYFNLKEFTDTEKPAADQIMIAACKKLGCNYTPVASGAGTTDTIIPANSAFSTVDGINTYVSQTKTKLDACKVQPVIPDDNDTPAPVTNSNVIIGGREYDTTLANAGQVCTISVPFVNLGKTDVTEVAITPVVSEDVAIWPFEIEKTDYSAVTSRLKGKDSDDDISSRTKTFEWTLKTRAKAVTGYTKITFNVSYTEEDGTKGTVALDYYVQVNGVAPTSADGGDGKVSTPRVIVTGFETNPEEVYAGDTFMLTLHIKNTSKIKKVSNLLFDIQAATEGKDENTVAAAFLPTAGSSTVYVDKISADGTTDIQIELKAKSDLSQKPYVVNVKMNYEDSSANPFEETASVSIPVKQEARVDTSSITLTPESIEIGGETNVMFSIYNTGKTKLYNVKVAFEGSSVSGGDTFLGNIDSGATGNVDTYLTGAAVTSDDGTIKVHITYEDEDGNEQKLEKEMTLYISDIMYDDTGFDDSGMANDMQNGAGHKWIWILVAVIVVLAGGLTAFFLIRKKKKKMQSEQNDLEEDETDNEVL